MNAQRWITVGILGLVAACIATAGLWIPLLPFGGDEVQVAEADLTATAQAALLPEAVEVTATPTSLASIEQIVSGEVNAMQDVAAEEEVDPVIADLLAALQKDTLAIGEDPFIIKVGNFVALDAMRKGEGTASVYQIGDMQWVLRLDPFSVTQGADLHVLLSQTREPRTSADALLPKYIDLGPLQSISGVQNYAIPATIEFGKYKSVVIYSISLNIIYTTAPLDEVRGGR